MGRQFCSPIDHSKNLRRADALLAIFAAAIFLALPFAAGRTAAQDKIQTQAPPTLTPQQIEDIHSHLFSSGQWQLDKEGKPIPEIPRQLATTSGDIYLRNIVVSETFGEADDPTRFGQFACFSDVIVLGAADTGISHMTSDKSYLYTDWEFSVERVFKNNPNASVQTGSRITIVAPGGTLQIDGRTIHASELVPLPAAGQRYLIFLTSVPKTGAYQAFNGYLISRGGIAPRGAFAQTVDTRTLDPSALFTLMEGGVTAATHMPNCKGVPKK
jgi:hypothetical protein